MQTTLLRTSLTSYECTAVSHGARPVTDKVPGSAIEITPNNKQLNSGNNWLCNENANTRKKEHWKQMFVEKRARLHHSV